MNEFGAQKPACSQQQMHTEHTCIYSSTCTGGQGRKIKECYSGYALHNWNSKIKNQKQQRVSEVIFFLSISVFCMAYFSKFS